MESGNRPRLSLEDDQLVFRFPAISSLAELRIEFQRTLRVPDDGNTYPLPAGLGRFPLETVEDVPLPESWRQRGGVFLPMYGSEALWINFEGRFPMAVKIATGKINAVSGKPWINDLDTGEQDYVIADQQRWLDGFNATDGAVRQFVARPLGEGSSVEEQLTGEATWGGLQIIVYPLKQDRWEMYVDALARKATDRKSLLLSIHEEVVWEQRSRHSSKQFGNLPRLAAAMGLGLGGRIEQTIAKDPWGIDAWDTSQRLRVFVHLLHALDYPHITGRPAPSTPISAKLYAEKGLPWFDWDAKHPALPPAVPFAKVKPVKSVLASQGISNLGDTPIDTSDIVTLSRRFSEGDG